SGGTTVNRNPVRWARLDHGDWLLVGDTMFGVRYQAGAAPELAPASSEPPDTVPLAELPSIESELALAKAQAEAEQARARIAELERELTDTAAARAKAEQELGAGQEGLEQSLAEARAEAERLRSELEAAREGPE